MTYNDIHFEKRLNDEEGKWRDTILVKHQVKNFVNVCGKCGYKQKMINEGENLKLQIARKQFNIFVGDDTDTECFVDCKYRGLFKSEVLLMPRTIRENFMECWGNNDLEEEVADMIDEVNEEEDEREEDEREEDEREENQTREPERDDSDVSDGDNEEPELIQPNPELR